MSTILKNLKKLPDSPGVYFFKDAKTKGWGGVLYIGKATSLKSRVRSYFREDLLITRGPKLAQMLELAKRVDFLKTDSVLEALLLEAELIRKHQPKYNTDLKDDKSHNLVVITKEDFPRVLLIRKKELETTSDQLLATSHQYGPFPHGMQLQEAMKIIRRIFPYRDKCMPAKAAGNIPSLSSPTPAWSAQGFAPRSPLRRTMPARGSQPAQKYYPPLLPRPCFNAQIGLCPGVCAGTVSKQEYAKTIRNIKLFFQGKKKVLVRKLKQEMNEHAKRMEFEKADMAKRQIFALEHIQDMALIKREIRESAVSTFRIEAYDVAHISGTNVVGVMVVVENGEANKSEYRKFKIKSFAGADDTRALKEVLERRLAHDEWQYPKLIVVDGGKAQISTAEKVLKEAGIEIPIVGVVKDERHRAKETLGETKLRYAHERAILLANSEAHRFAIKYHREKRGKIA